MSYDLDQKWIKSLRQINKRAVPTQPTLSCPLCPDRKVQQDYDTLRQHVVEAHADKLPQGDAAETEKFQDEIRSLALAPIISRYYQAPLRSCLLDSNYT